jgi:uncharacterized integral membrane protein (TIGR00697 family)
LTARLNLWTISLVGTFILALSLADLAATKFILIGSIVAPGGVFLFSVIFVVRDALHKLLGAEFVKQTILVAAALNLLMAVYFLMIARFPAPGFFADRAEPWNAIFALAPGIVIGSIIAAVASQWVNTIVYQKIWETGRPLWQRVIGSNVLSLPVDSILFVLFAFVILPPLFGASAIELGAVVGRIISGQTLIKLLIVIAMTPIVYLVPSNPALEPVRKA